MPSRTRHQPPRRRGQRRGRRQSVVLLAVLLLMSFAVPAGAAPGDPLPLTVSPGAVGTSSTPSVSFALESGESATCDLTGPDRASAPVPCTSGWSPAVPLSLDGDYLFAVSTTVETPVLDADGQPVLDADGQPTTTTTASRSATTPYTRDTAPPVVTVTAPTGRYADSTGWTVEVSEVGTSLTCSLGELVDGATVDRGPVDCAPGSVEPALPADGSYVLTATATDRAQLQGSATSDPYLHDGTAPVVVLQPADGQPARGSSRSVAFTFTVSDSTAAVRCSLSPAAPASSVCDPTGTYSATDLAVDGEYVLTVTATDGVGNAGSATGSYVLDTTGPAVVLSPAGTTTGTAASTTWTVDLGDAAPDTAVCTLDGAVVACAATLESATLAVDGSSTLVVSAADDLGTPGGATATYVRETTPGTPVVTVAPTSPGTDRTPTWTTTVDAAATAVACTLTGPGGATSAPACAVPGQTTDWTPAADLAEGEWTLSVVASNETGGASSAGSAAYVVDVSEPAGPVLVAAHEGTSGNASPLSWSWTAEAGRATQCQRTVDDVVGDWAPCTSPQSFTPAAGDTGSYGVAVQYVDGLGNTGPASSASYAYDGAAPAAPTVELRGTSPLQPGDVLWDLTAAADSGTVGFRCSLTGDLQPQACGSPLTRTLAEGGWTLSVQAVDAAGNLSAATTSTVVVDGTDPQPPVVTGDGDDPADVRSSRTTLSWTATASDDDTATLACRLVTDGVPAPVYGACAATWAVTASGTYALEAVARDLAGNESTPARGPQYTVDVTGPGAPTVTVDDAVDNEPTATWRITPTEPGVVECRLQHTSATAGSSLQHDWTPCASPYSPALTKGEGTYVLTARSSDDLSNQGEPSTGVVYELDLTPPAPAGTPVLDPARATDDETTVVWRWDGTAPDAECTLLHTDLAGASRSAVLATCTSGQDVVLGGEGQYRLQVVLLDEHGNGSAPATSVAYVLDTTDPVEPVVTVDGGLDGVTDNVLEVGYSFTGEGTATCRLYRDGAPVGEPVVGCVSPYGVVLPEQSGPYRLGVTTQDAAGNPSPEGLSGTYVLDVDAPLAPAVTVDPDTDDVESATWTVTPQESDTTSECRLHHDGVVVDPAWAPCAAPYAFPLLEGDGSYALEVRLTDAVGNLGPAVLGEPYLLDTLEPGRPVVDGPDAPSNVRTVTWSWTWTGAADGDTSSCRLLRDGVDVTAEVPGLPCTSGTEVQLPDVSGKYELVVVVTDAVGNPSKPGSSPKYPLDVTAPEPVVATTAAVSPSKERTVTWTFLAEATTTCRVALRTGVEGAWTYAPVAASAACTSPHTAELPDSSGAYVLEVVDTDAVGNASPVGRSAPYLLDVTPPATPAPTGPPATGNVAAVSWSFPGEGTATCQLVLAGALQGEPVACGPTFSTTLTSDGPWQLEVVRTDAVGNSSAPGRSTTYLLDRVLPPAPVLVGPSPAGPAQSLTPAWTVSGEAGATLECRLAGTATWTACPTGYTADLTGSPDGSYVLEARATDAATNVSPTATSTAYVLDTTAPTAPVVSGPSGPSPLRTPRFTWTGEAGTTATCQLAHDGAASGGPVACSSGFAPTLPEDGSWTVTVVLTDVALNASPGGTSGPYLLDTTPPPAPSVTAPASPGRDLAPVWGVAAEGGARLECRLTPPSGAVPTWSPCPSPLVTPLTGQPDGRYLLEVRATDAAGNTSGTGSAAYVLDTVAPAAAVLTGPAGPSRELAPSYSFTTEAGATTRCRTTSGATLLSDFSPCTSPTRLDLTGQPDGTYTLTVRVTDAAGNLGPSATATYVLDTTPPAVPVFTTVPASPDPARSVTWAFTSEPGAALRCTLTVPGGGVRTLTGCASPLTVDLTGLPDGSYLLAVVAVDRAGNASGPATATHVLSSTALRAPVLTPPPSPGSDRTPTWTVVGSGAECRLTAGTAVLRDWAPCGGAYEADLFGRPDGTYLLSARTRSGTATSATASSSYLLDTAGPGLATVTPPPSPSTNRAPTWTIASAEGVSAECRVLLFGAVLQDWEACPVSVAGSPYRLDLTGRGDGEYVLEVRLVDAAGNRGETARSTYVLDTSAPAGVGVQGPPSPGNDPRPVWRITSEPGVLLECRLTSGDRVLTDEWETCTTQFEADLTAEPDGTYVLAVRAVSAAGTPGPETTSAYELRRTGPARPVLTSFPPETGKERRVRWEFTLPPGTTARCLVETGGRTFSDGECSSPFVLDLSAAANGTYLLSVFAVDDAGNESEPAPGRYTLDTVPTAPPVFTAEPGSPSSTLEPVWHFTVPRGATAECRLLQGGTVLRDWSACTSPYRALLSGQPDGAYEVHVRSVDVARNASAPAVSRYLLDRTAGPTTTFTRVPASPADLAVAEWAFTVPTGTTGECRTTSARGTTSTWSPCPGRWTTPLTGQPDGTYVLEVRLVTTDGVRGPVSRSTHVRDTTAPGALRFLSEPSPVGQSASVSWTWAAPLDADVQCRLYLRGATVPAFGYCDDGALSDTVEQEGTWLLELRAVDAALNAGPVLTGSYVYDRTAPAAPVFTSSPASPGADRTVAWTFAVPAGTSALCTVTRSVTPVAGPVPCDGRYALDLSGQPDGDYVLTVVVVDAAGNRSPARSSSYALRTGGSTPPATGSGGTTDPSPGSPGGGSSGGADGPVRGGLPGVLAPTGGLLPPSVDDVLGGSDAPSSFPGGGNPVVPSPEQTSARPGGSTALGPLPVSDVPQVIRDVVAGTITKPTLPLALLAVVVLFLLAQNRIDRRDPKLAAGDAPEPELDFTAFVRRPGAAT